MSVLGEAWIAVRAKTDNFQKDLDDSTAAPLSKFEKDAGESGALAGANLSKGVKDGSKDLEQDMGDLGERSGSALSGGTEKHMGGIKSALSSLGVPNSLLGGWGAMGAAVLGVGVGAIDMGEKMQSADTSIANSAGISVKAATAIGNAFLGTALKSEFSGKEMATAYASVAGQLGAAEGHALTTAQALSVMNVATDLATAKQIDLGTATSTLASVMQAFQLPVSQAADASNVLFNASNATGQGIDTLGGVMDKVRSKMGALAPSFDEMGALLVDLTNHGETGRAATTALSTAFTGLMTPIGKLTPAQKLVIANQKELGLTFETSKGQLVPVSSIIAQMGPLIQGMGAAQATAMLQSVGFGSASSKLVATIQAGPAAFLADEAAVTKAGSAHDAAAKQSQTLAVEFKTLKAAAEDWMTQLGEKLIPVLSKLLGWVEKIVAGFQKDWPKIQAAIMGVWNAVSPTLDLLWKAISKVFTFVVNNKPVLIGVLSAIAAAVVTYTAVQAVQFGIQVAKWAATAAAAGISAATQIAAWVAVAAAATAAFVAENIASLGIVTAVVAIAAAAYELYKHWKEVWGDITTAALAAWHFIDNDVLHPIEAAFGAVVSFIKQHWQLLAEILLAPVAPALALFLRFHTQIIGFFSGIVDWAKSHFGEITDKVRNVVDDVVNFFKAVPGTVIHALDDIITWWLRLPEKIAAALASLGGVLYGIATKALTRFYDGLVDIFQTVKAWFGGVGGKIISALGDVGKLLFDVGKAIIQGLVNGIKSATHLVTDALNVVAKGIHDVTHLWGLIGSPSPYFITVGEAMMHGLSDGIVAGTPAAMKAAAGSTADIIRAAQAAITPLNYTGNAGISGSGAPGAGSEHFISSAQRTAGMIASATAVNITSAGTAAAKAISGNAGIGSGGDSGGGWHFTSAADKINGLIRSATETNIVSSGTAAAKAISGNAGIGAGGDSGGGWHFLPAVNKTTALIEKATEDDITSAGTAAAKGIKDAATALGQKVLAAAQKILNSSITGLSTATGQSGIIADQQTIANDIASMAGLTGDALTVAQDQLAIDQQKLAWDQQDLVLQRAVASAQGRVAQAAAQAALNNYDAIQTIQAATLAAALSGASNQASIDSATTTAASSVATATTAAASTVGNASTAITTAADAIATTVDGLLAYTSSFTTVGGTNVMTAATTAANAASYGTAAAAAAATLSATYMARANAGPTSGLGSTSSNGVATSALGTTAPATGASASAAAVFDATAASNAANEINLLTQVASSLNAHTTLLTTLTQLVASSSSMSTSLTALTTELRSGQAPLRTS